jgi:hypothetical protein
VTARHCRDNSRIHSDDTQTRVSIVCDQNVPGAILCYRPREYYRSTRRGPAIAAKARSAVSSNGGNNPARSVNSSHTIIIAVCNQKVVEAVYRNVTGKVDLGTCRGPAVATEAEGSISSYSRDDTARVVHTANPAALCNEKVTYVVYGYPPRAIQRRVSCWPTVAKGTAVAARHGSYKVGHGINPSYSLISNIGNK